MSNIHNFVINDGVLEKYNGNETHVIIPNTVKTVGNNAFFLNQRLTSVTVPDSVKSIGSFAFAYCESLSDIIIPDSVTEIGEFVFLNCRSITCMSIPESISIIPEGMFSSCVNLTDITIPKSAVSIGGKAFYDCEKLETINISESVVSIGDNAFAMCQSLTDITIPKSLTRIAEHAFYACENLKSINLSEGITSIGEHAFAYCHSLTDITIPESVTSIESNAFYACENLKSINLSASVNIGDSAFSYCPKLCDERGFSIVNGILFGYYGNETSVVIPDSIKIIGKLAFSSQSIKEVVIPDSVTSIKYGAFYKCESLESVNIPESVTDMEYGVFEGCTKLSDKEQLIIVNNVLYGYKGKEGNLVIPNYVTLIDKNALMYNDIIKSVTLPDNVSVGPSAFAYCSNLDTLIIPKRIKNIGENAFCGCRNLKNLVLPANLSDKDNLDLDAILPTLFEIFDKAELLAQLLKQLPQSMIGDSELVSKFKANAKKLVMTAVAKDDTEIIIKLFSLYKKVSLVTLDSYIAQAKNSPACLAFLLDYKNKTYTTEQQNRAEEVKIDKELGFKDLTVADWKKIYTIENTEGGILIKGYKGTESEICVPAMIGKNPVTAIGNRAFSPTAKGITYKVAKARQALVSVILPDSVTSIGEGIFEGCNKLANAVIPSSVKVIPAKSFADCKALKDIVIPADTKEIGSFCFENCNKLKNAVIPGSVCKIGEKAFYKCAALKDAGDYKNVKDIGVMAFSGCKKLADKDGFVRSKNILFNYYGNADSVIIPDGITYISYEAFARNKSIVSIVIPDSVTDIADKAFYGCESLKDINIAEHMDHMGQMVIRGCKNLADDNRMLIINATLLLYYGEDTEVVVPEGVKVIGDHAFTANKTMKSVKLPDSLEYIKEYAFSDSNLYEIYVPDSVIRIEASAFSYCRYIRKCSVSAKTSIDRFYMPTNTTIR